MEALRAYLQYADKQVDSVSKGGVDWHIYHALLVINGVYSLLQKSEPKDYKPKFSFLKFTIMNTGIIPRGRAKAPQAVSPPGQIDPHEIQDLFDKVEQQLKALENLEGNHFYSHHIFGDLNLKRSVKFLNIHTQHHLKIIMEIVAK